MIAIATHAANATAELDERVAHAVAAALRGLKYGTVTITLHDSAVVSIDRLERTRLPAPK